ncbi:RNA-dependent RNA polymerase [Aspergillus lentulus totivirus 1]|uniref:RNA-directed RNA polymerase n=1 Tax=Aspergillus lentulus totivirus 1 TaxID=2747491 RepID=A0A7I8CXG5_9VIRU|nr:RNA-dependent RNA polymerase [Aspergillus lentulus totivirus 1]
MNHDRVSDRANATGAVGQYLKGLLDLDWCSGVIALPYAEQISAIYQPTYADRRVTTLERAAAAFLVPDFPVQVAVSDATISHVISAVVSPRPARPDDPATSKWATTVGGTVRHFPLKRNPAASNKVNVYLSEVLHDLRAHSPNHWAAAASALWPYRGELYNDQASGVVLYGSGLAGMGVRNAYSIAAHLAYDPDLAKHLTSFFKAIGANGCRLGAALVEANTLQGRDVGMIDLRAEATYRTTDAVNDKLANFSEDELRSACRKILTEEISHGPGGLRVDYPSLEEHWDERWAWAVNGAHSGHVSKLYPRLPRPPGMLREHRRAWLESVEHDPRPTWDGHTYVSVSPKLEAGKTRAIFACDTVNYLFFEHLLGPVERRWRHKHVILDPGKGGHCGMAFATAAARARAGVSMMLDYDDFNSQHSTLAMKVLISELCDLTGYPPEYARVLLDSFDKCDIYLGDEFIGRARGTLMSGHRGTTFINSCLNRAYLMIVLGEETVARASALHVGDDVYFGVTTYRQAGLVASTLASSPLRMNPMKQSVGHVSTEFLRNASSGRSTRGYLARGVAGVVAGNWVNELALSPSEAITSMIASGRTLANRSTVDFLPLLLFSSVVRMTRLPKEDHKKLRDLLTGATALDNGPQFYPGGYYRSVPLLVSVAQTDRFGLAPLPRAATTAFLTRAAEPLEVSVLTQAGVSVVGAMEEASFRKSLPARYNNYETVRLGGLTLTQAIGTASVADLINVPAPVGVLSKYPLLTLAKQRIPEWLLRWAVGQAGGNPSAVDLNLEAWGEFKHGCIVATPLSYADASMYGHRTNASVLTCPIDICV